MDGRISLEREAIESESLVELINRKLVTKSNAPWIGSMKTALLRANSKHMPKTDSVLVPRGKAEKYL